MASNAMTFPRERRSGSIETKPGAAPGKHLHGGEPGTRGSALSTPAGSPSRPEPRLGRPRARRFRLLPVLALLLAALSPFAAAPAAADVLVSNIGQTRSLWTAINSSIKAQGFTTGSHTAGYTLESIEFDVNVRGTLSASYLGTVKAELWSDNGSGRPNAKLADLTVPSSVSTGAVAFAAPANTTLSASTNYFAVLYSTANFATTNDIQVEVTAATAEDSGAATGWSIANIGLFIGGTDPSSVTTWSTGGPRTIRVNGSAVQTSQPTGTIWSATLTVKEVAGNLGCLNALSNVECSSTSVLTDDDFTLSGTDWAITGITSNSTELSVQFSRNVQTALDSYSFCVGTTALAFSSANHTSNDSATWSTTVASGWSADDTVSLSIGTSCPQATRSTNASLSRLTAGSSTSSTGTFTNFSIGNFSATTTAYTATVAHAQTHVKLTPTVADTGKATVGVRKGQGSFTAVTDRMASDAIALDVGSNTFVVRVTAEDTTTTRDYTVTVTRRVAPSSTPIWSGMLTVQDISGDGGILGCANPSTGNECSSTSILDDDDFTLSGTTWEITAITRSGSGLNLNVSRDAQTALDRYHICVGTTAFAFSDAGHGNGASTASWTSSITWTVGGTVRVSIAGASCAQGSTPTQSTNADLSALTAGSSTSSGGQYTNFSIGTFGASTTTYTATVANDQTHVKLTPTVDDTGKATVGVRKGTSGNFTPVTDGTASSAIALTVGSNTLVVRVTAEDTTTTKDYTVTVTRRAAGSSPKATTAVSGTMTVGDGGSWKGFRANPSVGALSDADFTYGGVDYRILGLRLTNSGGYLYLHLNKALARNWGLVLNVGDSRFRIADAALFRGNYEGVLAGWGYANQGETPPSWSVGDTVPVSLGTLTSSTVKLSVSPNPVAEGASATVEACLSAVPQGTVRIPVTLSHGTSEDGDWGVSLSGDTDGRLPVHTAYSIVISGWLQRGCGTVKIPTHPDSDDDDETFIVALDTTRLPPGVQAGSPASVVVTIQEPRNWPKVTLRAVRSTVAEGSPVELQVTLEEPPATDVAIPLRVRFVTSETGDHGFIRSITIKAGATTGTGTIRTHPDDDTEDERFQVAVVQPDLPSGVAAGRPSVVGITIADGANARLRALDLSGN